MEYPDGTSTLFPLTNFGNRVLPVTHLLPQRPFLSTSDDHHPYPPLRPTPPSRLDGTHPSGPPSDQKYTSSRVVVSEATRTSSSSRTASLRRRPSSSRLRTSSSLPASGPRPDPSVQCPLPVSGRDLRRGRTPSRDTSTSGNPCAPRRPPTYPPGTRPRSWMPAPLQTQPTPDSPPEPKTSETPGSLKFHPDP